MLGATIGCGTEAPVPGTPTWVDDVKPIMQANCFNCHGATASWDKWQTVRWDVYDLTDPTYRALGFTEVMTPPSPEGSLRTWVSARDLSHFRLIPIYLSANASDDGRMPPPPATRLSARDVAVLEAWAASGFARGTRGANAKPAISWLDDRKTFAVTDGDDDQVLGKLDCGGTPVPLDRSGNHTLPDGVAPPCSGMLYDGFDLVSVELK